ncbi:FXYD domain containing ion transport regulator 5 isoform X1 [Scyliorhinus canicula]|uniref:FXYD domain containing ion transport regulator 5 isoform X1 n=1 Tax=Scyliorhinus canicula TaxID=7830 RepID=UPI0018F2D206|nr:FXYD domain containing ion transport regulator 5 isoform X1 [Scyliorhinus canicula]
MARSPGMWMALMMSALSCLFIGLYAEDNQTSLWELSDGNPVTNSTPALNPTDTWLQNSSELLTGMDLKNWTEESLSWSDDVSSPSTPEDFTDAWDMSTQTRMMYSSSDQPGKFDYDYAFLRKWGLVVAFLLFVVGILVLFLDRLRMPQCSRLKTGRKHGKYNITTET